MYILWQSNIHTVQWCCRSIIIPGLKQILQGGHREAAAAAGRRHASYIRTYFNILTELKVSSCLEKWTWFPRDWQVSLIVSTRLRLIATPHKLKWVKSSTDNLTNCFLIKEREVENISALLKLQVTHSDRTTASLPDCSTSSWQSAGAASRALKFEHEHANKSNIQWIKNTLYMFCNLQASVRHMSGLWKHFLLLQNIPIWPMTHHIEGGYVNVT